MRAILTAIGHECQEATNGIQALDYIRHNQVDLVVTDLDMPGMNGFQLLAAIGLLRRSRRPPVIVVSARLDDGIVERRPELRLASAMLNKPLDLAKFLEVVGSHVLDGPANRPSLTAIRVDQLKNAGSVEASERSIAQAKLELLEVYFKQLAGYLSAVADMIMTNPDRIRIIDPRTPQTEEPFVPGVVTIDANQWLTIKQILALIDERRSARTILDKEAPASQQARTV